MGYNVCFAKPPGIFTSRYSDVIYGEGLDERVQAFDITMVTDKNVLNLGYIHPNHWLALRELRYFNSAVTHPHPRSCMCCVLYALTAHYMLEGISIVDAIDLAVNYATSWVHDSVDREALDYIRNYEHNESTGSGYVVDSLWSAYRAVWRTNTFSDAIKTAIAYGNDTDTTACIAGGLAGIRYGLNMLPSDWLFNLRGRELIDPIADRLAGESA